MRTPLHTSALFRIRFFRWLRVQLILGARHAPVGLRFLSAFACAALAVGSAYIFFLLPSGWPMTVAAHLDTLPGAIMTAMLVAYGMLAFGFAVLSRRIERTLWR